MGRTNQQLVRLVELLFTESGARGDLGRRGTRHFSKYAFLYSSDPWNQVKNREAARLDRGPYNGIQKYN